MPGDSGERLDLSAIWQCLESLPQTEAWILCLQDDLRMQNEGPTDAASRIIMLPTVIVNDKQYRGRLDAPSITRALCSGFDESTEPEVCPDETASSCTVR